MARVGDALVIAAADRGEVGGLPDAEVVIAADSGADVALACERAIDVVVGDMDSISDEALARARHSGARIVEHPPDKDETDLELALKIAVEAADRVHVVMGAGGRLDHAIANLTVICSPRWSSSAIVATVGSNRAWVVRDDCPLDVEVGDTVSLIPMGGPASGVTTTGLRYQLEDETLDPLTGRGVSNVIESLPARVAVRDGVVLVIRPG